MTERLHDGRERQLSSLARRLRELEERVHQEAPVGNRTGSHQERRSVRSELEAEESETRRLRREAERLEVEPAILGRLIPTDIDGHLGAIEQQLEEVQEAREIWDREALAGRRRRAADRVELQRLREENERLTAELQRCAALLCSDPERIAHPRALRVWRMLRLPGS